MIDNAGVNPFIMFEIYSALHPEAIPRRKNFRRTDFQANLIRQLANIAVNEPLPKFSYRPSVDNQTPAAHLHLPGHSQQKKNRFLLGD